MVEKTVHPWFVHVVGLGVEEAEAGDRDGMMHMLLTWQLNTQNRPSHFAQTKKKEKKKKTVVPKEARTRATNQKREAKTILGQPPICRRLSLSLCGTFSTATHAGAAVKSLPGMV